MWSPGYDRNAVWTRLSFQGLPPLNLMREREPGNEASKYMCVVFARFFTDTGYLHNPGGVIYAHYSAVLSTHVVAWSCSSSWSVFTQTVSGTKISMPLVGLVATGIQFPLISKVRFLMSEAGSTGDVSE